MTATTPILSLQSPGFLIGAPRTDPMAQDSTRMDTTAGTINRIRIGAARMAHMDMDGGHTILFSLGGRLRLQRCRHRRPSLLNSEIAIKSYFFLRPTLAALKMCHLLGGFLLEIQRIPCRV